MITHVTRDIERVTAVERNLAQKAGAVFLNLGLHAVLLYRLARWLHLHRVSALGMGASYVNSVITGAQISRHAAIGKGLVIYHPHGTVVGATAVIGPEC